MSAPQLRPTQVPSAFQIRELFEGLLGRDTEWDGSAARVDPLEGATVAIYTNDFGSLAAVALADIPLTAWAGSAIALLPHMGAESAVADALVTPAQFDNMTEILNVAASLFNRADTPHLKLHETFAPRETLPADVTDLALLQGSRIDGSLSIQGYGGGRLSIVVAY